MHFGLRIELFEELVPGEFDASVERCIAVDPMLVFPLCVGVVDDVAECCGIRSKILDLTDVFISARPVQCRVQEVLHRVEVEQMLRDFMIRVGQYLRSQRCVHLAELGDVEEKHPMFDVHPLHEVEVHRTTPVILVSLQFLNLEIDESLSDLSQRRKVLVVHVEQVKNHPPIRCRELLRAEFPPVEAEPLEVLRSQRGHRQVPAECIDEERIVALAET